MYPRPSQVGTAVPLWDVAARCDAEDLRDAVRRFCLTHGHGVGTVLGSMLQAFGLKYIIIATIPVYFPFFRCISVFFSTS